MLVDVSHTRRCSEHQLTYNSVKCPDQIHKQNEERLLAFSANLRGHKDVRSEVCSSQSGRTKLRVGHGTLYCGAIAAASILHSEWLAAVRHQEHRT